MEAHKDSKMWQDGGLDKVTGKTAFDYKDSDPYAKEVVENYITYLAEGVTDIANIFRPEVVLLGGGVCAQGDNLVKPLQEKLDRDIFAGDLGPKVKILIAELENSAGILGAAALLMDWGIVMGNDPYLYGDKVKAYLRKGARPIPGEMEYPNPRVGYGTLCVADSIPK
jgi:predicted NBD/HSP70 family sugar kinase